MPRGACAHCGLPISVGVHRDGVAYCCYGCFIVSRIVGSRDGRTMGAWSILRLAVGALLSMNVMMLALLMYTNSVEPGLHTAFRWVMLALAAPAMVLLGQPFVIGALQEIRRRRLSLDTLIAVGSLSAFGVSVANTVAAKGHVYFDTATMLLTLVTLGKLIEAGAKTRTHDLLCSLQTLLPAAACRMEDDRPVEMPLASLRVGDRLLVRPGERFAADGVVLDGRSVVEEAAFTGEWQPREIAAGSAVVAGTVNAGGVITIKASAVGEGLLLRRIVDMVEQARQRPSRIERQAQRLAAWMVPAVFVAAALAAACWLAAGEPARAGLAALAVLVVACPCAMGIAAPLATALAIARAARDGAIVRGGDVLETIGVVKQFFFDKTGTLTGGTPQVVAIEDDGIRETKDESRDNLLRLAAAVESHSEHVLARAIVQAARSRNLEIPIASNVQVLPGLGVRGLVRMDGRQSDIMLGSQTFMKEQGLVSGMGVPPMCLEGVSPSIPDSKDHGRDAHATAQTHGQDGHATRIGVAANGRLVGWLALSDPPRSEAADAIAALHALGVQTAILSGDANAATSALAAELGIANVHAPCRPDEKVALLTAAGNHGPAAMVGDGINDAPALACTDIGVAMGAGTDLARQVGNVVLIGSDLGVLPQLVALSRRTRRIILQNLLWAAGYNAVAVNAAAMGYLHPLLAAVAMVVSSLTVLGNSLRLQR